MRLTRAGDYAVRCVMHLAEQEKGRVVNRHTVAEAMEIPEPFLGKIARQLATGGILDVVQGARGGYRLASDPARLTLLEVVEAVMGPICLNQCVDQPESCPRHANCPAHLVWIRINGKLREMLQEVTFADLSNGNGHKP